MFVAVFRIAAALGVFLAGYMTLVDWRILFGIGIIAVFFIPILAKNLPDEHAKGARVDVIGFTLIGLFAGSVTMFFTDMTIFWGIAVLVTGVASWSTSTRPRIRSSPRRCSPTRPSR